MSRQEAEQAIRAYLRGDDSPEGKRLFDQWYASFADNERSALDLSEATADRLWQRIDEQTLNPHDGQPDRAQPRVVAMPINRRYGWVAAAVVLLTCLATGVWYVAHPPRPGASAVAYVERINAAGQRSVVRLPDGSRVHLNAASQLRFPQTFAGRRRQVWLTGEAFFEVRPNPNQPFVVQTGELQTTVLGTSFNVRAYSTEGQISVAVVTGKVRVADARKTVWLTPNQLATYQMDERTLGTTAVSNARDRSAWTAGRLVFQKQKLADIIRVLNRHYDVNISLSDQRLASYALNVEFDNEPLKEVLDVLCGYLKTGYKRSGRDIVIGR